jgi:hypothetical protein
MHYEVFSASKSKTGARPSDDVTLFIPGVLAAVLDGATDPLGHKVDGKSSGRFAAESVAQACSKLFSDTRNTLLSANEIVDYLARDLSDRIAGQGFAGAPSTTLAMTLFQEDAVRLIVVGDSGIRVNQDQVFRHEKLIDEITTFARIAVFSILRSRIDDYDELEATSRSVAFLGIDRAMLQNVLTTTEVQAVFEAVQKEFAKHEIATDIHDLLSKGIQSQHLFSNNSSHPLGFSALNGSPLSMSDVVEMTFQRTDLRSIEIFSDGYAKLPSSYKVSAWEKAHHEVEHSDYHKIAGYPSVKGSTTTEYFDDRSVISLLL